jgi:hypothetical protein
MSDVSVLRNSLNLLKRFLSFEREENIAATHRVGTATQKKTRMII